MSDTVMERQRASQESEVARDELGVLLDALQRAQGDEARQAATLALTAWCREHLVHGGCLGALLQSSLADDEKTRVLGELRAEIARNEFLLGWSFVGGVSSGRHWELDGPNLGIFPDYYMEAVKTYGREDGAYWCTSFAGHTATRLGFECAPGNAEASFFWSGYRLDKWARAGKTTRNIQVTPVGQVVAAEGNASVLIEGRDWERLYNTLHDLTERRPAGQRDEDLEAALQRAVDEFLDDHATPQAGDMFVYDGRNRVKGNSHTNLVERYDAKARTIYTIGGNESHAVGGRRKVLTDPSHVRRLASMVRIGAEFYTGVSGSGPGGDGSRLGAELVRAARAINTRIVAVLDRLGYIKSCDGDATVLEWHTGDLDADTGTSNR